MKVVKENTIESIRDLQENEVTIQANAQLTHYIIGGCGEIHVSVGRNALYSPFLLSTADGSQKTKLHIYLTEPGAEVDLKGLLLGKENQTINNLVSIYHQAENTNSNQYLKTLSDDNAKIEAISTILIDKKSKNSAAHQLAKNVTLSDNAVVKTDPRLEIDNEDVVVSHGSSVGSLSPESLFYLQARGLTKDMAQEKLTQAFIQEILDLVEDESILSEIEYARS